MPLGQSLAIAFGAMAIVLVVVGLIWYQNRPVRRARDRAADLPLYSVTLPSRDEVYEAEEEEEEDEPPARREPARSAPVRSAPPSAAEPSAADERPVQVREFVSGPRASAAPAAAIPAPAMPAPAMPAPAVPAPAVPAPAVPAPAVPAPAVPAPAMPAPAMPAPAMPAPATPASPTPAPAPAAPAAGSEHAILAHGVPGTQVEGHLLRFSVPQDGTLQFLPGRLEIRSGLDTGREIRFVRVPGPDGTTVTFGRVEGPAYRHIQLREATVSRNHARLTLADGQWHLTNHSTTNPVVHNGRTLDHDETQPLTDGDRIEMGEVVFEFRSR
jgi:hypothetical protein